MRVKRSEGPAIAPRTGVAPRPGVAPPPEAPERCPADCLCAGRLARSECNLRIDRLYNAVVERIPPPAAERVPRQTPAVERVPRETPATTLRPPLAAQPATAALSPEYS